MACKMFYYAFQMAEQVKVTLEFGAPYKDVAWLLHRQASTAVNGAPAISTRPDPGPLPNRSRYTTRTAPWASHCRTGRSRSRSRPAAPTSISRRSPTPPRSRTLTIPRREPRATATQGRSQRGETRRVPEAIVGSSTSTNTERGPVLPAPEVPVALRVLPAARIPARVEEVRPRVTPPLIGSDVLLSGEELSLVGPGVQLTEEEMEELLR